ncbi:MAG: YHS domain-containing protein, partial [Afipia sp.]|nr:YHS domain-containing protein [Afipia sp.]
MSNPEKANSKGECGCSSKASAAPGPDETKAACCGGGHDHDAHEHHHHPVSGDGKVMDPVCGMTVDPTTSKHRFDYQGHIYHFCSAGCRTKFAAAPETYLDKSKAAPKEPVPEGTVYT